MNAEIDVTGVKLKTERLVLRPFKAKDVNDLFEYAKVEGVGEMAGWKHHRDIVESKLVCAWFIDGKKTFAIEMKHKVIGSIGVETYNEEDFPEFAELKVREIGYVLSKDYWGQGIMKEAVSAVIKWCFESVGLDALLCGAFDFNSQSRRVQEKLGFKYYKDRPRFFYHLMDKEIGGTYSLLFRDEETAKKLPKV